MKPHKHADLIKAWADGAEIEGRYLNRDGWGDWHILEGGFIWYHSNVEYRIKPEPKPDVVRYALISSAYIESINLTSCAYIVDNIKLTFDGETGKLKSAEVIK
jgi:hypothetical protein